MPAVYGGPTRSLLQVRLGVLAFLAVAGVYVWQMTPAPRTCTDLRSTDVETNNKDGKTLSVLRLDKLNLKPGECVRIGP